MPPCLGAGPTHSSVVVTVSKVWKKPSSYLLALKKNSFPWWRTRGVRYPKSALLNNQSSRIICVWLWEGEYHLVRTKLKERKICGAFKNNDEKTTANGIYWDNKNRSFLGQQGSTGQWLPENQAWEPDPMFQPVVRNDRYAEKCYFLKWWKKLFRH